MIIIITDNDGVIKNQLKIEEPGNLSESEFASEIINTLEEFYETEEIADFDFCN